MNGSPSFEFDEAQIDSIKNLINRSRPRPDEQAIPGFLGAIEQRISLRLLLNQPKTEDVALNEKMPEIAKIALLLSRKLNGLNTNERNILRQHWFLANVDWSIHDQTNFDAHILAISKLANDLYMAADSWDQVRVGTGNANPNSKEVEKDFCYQVISEWIKHFNSMPGKTRNGPFHNLLNMLSSFADLRPIREDIFFEIMSNTKSRKL